MILLAAAMSMSLAAQSADDTIVSGFYPDRLLAGIDSEDLVRSFRYVRADLDGSGQRNYIVAVYYNGMNDILRVLKVQNGVTSLADEPDMPNMGGGRGSVRTVDVDGDGKPEVLLSIAGERQSEDWLLKWNGSKLSILSPARTDSRGKPHSLLSSVQLLDIDGDGLPELLVRYAPLRELPIMRVYKLVNGAFVAAPDAYLHDRFVRTKGEQDEFDYTFSVSAPGNYILHVVNGDARGNERVNAGEIDINDRVLVNEQCFKEQSRTLDMPVTLAALNEIYVLLRSAPGSEITVSLSKAE